jgi:hypothetical protein
MLQYFQKNIFFCPWKQKKRASKVAHNRPQTFFSQVRPGCPNQPRIDSLYYKYVSRFICLLICDINGHEYFFQRPRPSPIALEPCMGNRAAVLSLIVRMPTGGKPYTPNGYTGIAIASSLVTLGNIFFLFCLLFSNFSCRFLNLNYFFQFKFKLF